MEIYYAILSSLVSVRIFTKDNITCKVRHVGTLQVFQAQ